MATQIQEFRGLKAVGVHSWSRGALGALKSTTARRPSRTQLTVEAFKKVAKRKQIVLLGDVEKLGRKGDLVTVSMGYWRNHLLPFRKAKAATSEILAAIQAEKDAEQRRLDEIKEKAERVATALKTIGKFIVKKKAGDEGILFGSLKREDVVSAISQQTGQELDKREINLPEIREIGTYDVSVKLHKEVTGFFKIVVEKQNTSGRK